ncbi:MAG: metal ABC transporter permease [Anaerorhabdus sp.]
MENFSILLDYFQYPFVQYAFIVGVLIAVSSALVGVPLVLKRFSFIGDGLSHLAFGVLAFASVLDVTNSTLVVMPITIVFAIILLKTGKSSKLNGDALLAMVAVSSLAIGYLIMNVFSVSANVAGDVCVTLFGSISILTLNAVDVQVCLFFSIIVLAVFVLFYHRIFAITFDVEFAKASGIHEGRYNLLIAVMTAILIVLAMNLVGSLLISALLIFPPLSAMRLCVSFKSVVIVSAILGGINAAVGILISILASTPVGATIVLVSLISFLGCYGIGQMTGRNV